MKDKIIIWFESKKLVIGSILVVLSFILGFYGKGLLILKFYEPFYLITGLSIWAFSWILLFLGAFLIGWETANKIQTNIRNQLKKAAHETYHYTKELPKRGYRYTKELHKKGSEKLTKASKLVADKIKNEND